MTEIKSSPGAKPEFLSSTSRTEGVIEPRTSLLHVGSRTIVTFKEEFDRYGRTSIISKQFSTKHILADRMGMPPETDVQYVVKLIKDTGAFTGRGAFIAEVERPTKFGEVQLALKEKGYKVVEAMGKEDMITGVTRTTEDAKKLYETYSTVPPGSDIKILDFAGSDTGELDTSRYSICIGPAGVDLDLDEDLLLKSKLLSATEPSAGTIEPLSARIPAASMPKPAIPVTEPTTFERRLPPVPTHIVETTPIRREEILPVIPPIETMTNGNIRILDLEVEKIDVPGERVPSSDKFKFFTLDKPTLELVYRIASAYNRRSPFFVEGGTATSKTSSAEFFAHLIGADVYRLNLSGQTDTSELLGRYVPNDGNSQRKYDAIISGWNNTEEEAREKAYKRVSEKSSEIFKKAYEEHRVLTKEENIQIATNEGISISETTWVWQNGIIPEAMINGGIVILDEATLSQPEIIECINSAMEQPPSLVISSNGGLTIGKGGNYDVHPNFWILGTGNSAGMAGRNSFSEAFQRRLTDYYIAPDPTRVEYSQMLRFMVYGTQPEVSVNGIKYNAERAIETPYFRLKDVRNIDRFLNNLASFHADMVNLTNPANPTIGKERRKGGKYTITRQNLLSVMQFISQEKILDIPKTVKEGRAVYSEDWRKKAQLALERFYIDPVMPQDRILVKDAMNKYPVAEVL